MLRDLMVPEAQQNAYVCAAVLAAHAGLGCAGWGILQAYEMTGLGGTVVAPYSVATDPLPNPTPLGG